MSLEHAAAEVQLSLFPDLDFNFCLKAVSKLGGQNMLGVSKLAGWEFIFLITGLTRFITGIIRLMGFGWNGNCRIIQKAVAMTVKSQGVCADTIQGQETSHALAEIDLTLSPALHLQLVRVLHFLN